MIRDGENGLLADFFNPEEFAAKAIPVLKDPDAFRPLGRAAEQMIREQYSLDAVLPRMLSLYEEARNTPINQPMPDPAMKAPDVPIPVAPTRAASGVVSTVRPKGKSPFRG
jgi:hypothetical protein